MAEINYTEKIPNNVDLANNRTLQRALEHWQPRFLDWWNDLGPEIFQNNDVYLRTATSVDREGWATFGMVRMPEYRWGIFLADQDPNRTIGFGDNIGQPAWQNWIFIRPNAVGEQGALKLFGSGTKPKFTWERI